MVVIVGPIIGGWWQLGCGAGPSLPLVGCTAGPLSLLVGAHVGHSLLLVGAHVGHSLPLVGTHVGCSSPLVGSGAGPLVSLAGDGVGCSSLLIPFMGGVLLWLHCHHVLVMSSHRVVLSCCCCCMVVLSHHCCLLWSLLWSVIVVISCLLSEEMMTNDNVVICHLVATSMMWAPVSWSGRGLWGQAVGAYLGLDMALSPSDEAAHLLMCHVIIVTSHQPGMLSFPCQLLMWCFCIVWMVYRHVKVVVSGWW